jgi:hypothetical protein
LTECRKAYFLHSVLFSLGAFRLTAFKANLKFLKLTFNVKPMHYVVEVHPHIGNIHWISPRPLETIANLLSKAMVYDSESEAQIDIESSKAWNEEHCPISSIGMIYKIIPIVMYSKQ